MAYCYFSAPHFFQLAEVKQAEAGARQEEDSVVDVLDMSLLQVVLIEARVQANRDLRVTGSSCSTA